MAKKKAKAKTKAKKPAKKSAPKKSAAKKGPAKAKKPASKSSAKSKGKASLPKPVFGASSKREIQLGEVEDYFAKIGVIALTLKDSLAVGQTIHVKGHTTDLTQICSSMQIDHDAVQSARKGDGIGMKVDVRCRKGDKVFRVL